MLAAHAIAAARLVAAHLLAALLTLPSCVGRDHPAGWRCAVRPTVGQDGKSLRSVYGFTLSCTQN